MSINTTNKINNGWHSIKDCYLSNNITKDDWRTIRMNALRFLLTERLENYGYDFKSWNRLKNQRYRAKATIKVNFNDFSIRYNVCQSSNEEITNLMRTLIYGVGGNKFKSNN